MSGQIIEAEILHEKNNPGFEDSVDFQNDRFENITKEEIIEAGISMTEKYLAEKEKNSRLRSMNYSLCSVLFVICLYNIYILVK